MTPQEILDKVTESDYESYCDDLFFDGKTKTVLKAMVIFGKQCYEEGLRTEKYYIDQGFGGFEDYLQSLK